MKYHTFRGKKYKVRHVKAKTLQKDIGKDEVCFGECDNPETPGKELRFDKELSGIDKLDTYIHEAIHAAFPDLTEEAVEIGSTDIAKFLWRIGYRLKNGNTRSDNL